MTTQNDVISALRTLAAPAPSVVTERTLVATGHYDQYDTVDGPTGPLAVAFNDYGVSGVVPMADPDTAAADLAT